MTTYSPEQIAALVERGAIAAHTAYRAERVGGKLHAPEDCPCRDGHLEPEWLRYICNGIFCVHCGNQKGEEGTRCHACRAAMREWSALTEAARETFRVQARPIVEALSDDDRLQHVRASVNLSEENLQEVVDFLKRHSQHHKAALVEALAGQRKVRE